MSARRRDPVGPNEGAKRYVRRDENGHFIDDRIVDPHDQGTVLRELYRRLVSIHHGLATAGPDDEDSDVFALERLDDAMRFISEQPAYRVTREAERRARPLDDESVRAGGPKSSPPGSG